MGQLQPLEVDLVPSGVYDVVNIVNSDRMLLEKNYDNNASSIAISVQWPNGAVNPPGTIEEAPVVRMIRSCPGKSRCARTHG